MTTEIQVYELMERDQSIYRDGYISSITLKYTVTGTENPDTALAQVRSTAYSTRDNLTLDTLSITDYENGVFTISASYSIDESSGGYSEEEADETSPTESFDCSTGSMDIQVAIKQDEYTNNDNLDIVGDYIGWNGKQAPDAEFKGVNALTATAKKSYAQPMRAERLDADFERHIHSLTGKVNNNSWKGYEAGELLFLGASYSGNMAKRTVVTVTYNFAIQFNEYNVEVSGYTIPLVKGWEYVWSVAGAQNVVNGKINILGLWVSQVYKEVDFSTLGIN